MHEVLKHPAAVLVVLKLIEAGTSRRQQDDITGASDLRGALDSPLERLSLVDGDATCDLRLDFRCGRSDQQRKDAFFAQKRLKRRVVAALISAPENDENAAGESIQRFQRGVDIRGLGVVVIAHASDLADKFETMLDTRESAHSSRNRAWFSSSQTRGRSGSEDVLQIVRTRNGDVGCSEENLF